jgi:hypothetical protein
MNPEVWILVVVVVMALVFGLTDKGVDVESSGEHAGSADGEEGST